MRMHVRVVTMIVRMMVMMRVPVVMRVAMIMQMIVAMVMSVIMTMPMVVLMGALHAYLESKRSDHAALDRMNMERVAGERELCQLALEVLDRQAGREQGSDRHVPGHTGKTIKIGDAHRDPWC